MLNVLSLGAGVQSSALALMYAAGELGPMPDAAIFADTQGEPARVYSWLKYLRERLPFPVETVTAGSLWDAATNVRETRDGERTYIEIGIPVYTLDGIKGGLGRRQCTRTFKIEPIVRRCRDLLGVKRVMRSAGVLVRMAVGISLDECDRMKPSQTPWIESHWPLVERGFTRGDCLEWMQRGGHPEPPRSACTYCPFHSDAEWLALEPAEFADAVEKEKVIQRAYAQASVIKSVPFFHASRVPLGEVTLKKTEHGPEQLNAFRNECEGLCGV